MEKFIELMSKIIRFINVPGIKVALIIGIVVVVGSYISMVGGKETCRRLKKNRVKILVGCSVLVVAFFSVFLPAGLKIQEAGDYEAMAPLDWENREVYGEQDVIDVTLNFAEKERISLGVLGFHGKYGFRKELVIEEPTAFSMGIPPDFNMEYIHFGIYRDKGLTDPIDEADAGYNFNANWHIEEGADLSDYPNYKTSLFSLLQPGTYYVAVYSTSPFEDKLVYAYESWYDVQDSDLTLKEGQYQYFYAEPGKEYEFPFTVADNAEIVLETFGVAGTLTLYGTDGKTVIETLNIDAEQPYKESKKNFTFEKGGTYCFRLTDYPREQFKEHHYGWGELYSNWLRYRNVK